MSRRATTPRVAGCTGNLKTTGTVQNWNDRRLDLYDVQYREKGETRSL